MNIFSAQVLRSICLVLLLPALLVSAGQAQETPAPQAPVILPLPANLAPMTAANVQNIAPLMSFDLIIQQTVISPDATLIAVASQSIDSDYRITVYRIDTGDPVANIGGRMDLFDTMAWSPDSAHLAVAGGYLSGGGTELLNVRTYTITRGLGNRYAMGQSDTWFSYGFDRSALFSQQDERFSTLERHIDLSWAPTSELLGISFIDRFALLDVRGNSEVFSTVLEDVSRIDIQWSSDGRYLIISPDAGAIQLWGLSE